jgi:hypothetical protein
MMRNGTAVRPLWTGLIANRDKWACDPTGTLFER